jgi:hypothetical protein
VTIEQFVRDLDQVVDVVPALSINDEWCCSVRDHDSAIDELRDIGAPPHLVDEMPMTRSLPGCLG